MPHTGYSSEYLLIQSRHGGNHEKTFISMFAHALSVLSSICRAYTAGGYACECGTVGCIEDYPGECDGHNTNQQSNLLVVILSSWYRYRRFDALAQAESVKTFRCNKNSASYRSMAI